VLSVDTNILLYAFNQDAPGHRAAYAWIASIQRQEEVAISELVLAELYRLIRNPAVLRRPLTAEEAVEVIQVYRAHPRWRLIGFPAESRAFHDELWRRAGARDFAFRRFFDVRNALSMISQGVTEFATANVGDFQGLGFRRVFNPIARRSP
jgi:toxin-antitoxin system PIN domain toxin